MSETHTQLLLDSAGWAYGMIGKSTSYELATTKGFFTADCFLLSVSSAHYLLWQYATAITHDVCAFLPATVGVCHLSDTKKWTAITLYNSEQCIDWKTAFLMPRQYNVFQYHTI
jgi:hypothetical protein